MPTETSTPSSVAVTVIDTDGARTTLAVENGRSLRRALLSADLSPYTPLTAHLNCGGNGICATCGVRIREEIRPTQWHDRLADRFGYPRLSCQVTVTEPITVELVEKRVWGSREHDSA